MLILAPFISSSHLELTRDLLWDGLSVSAVPAKKRAFQKQSQSVNSYYSLPEDVGCPSSIFQTYSFLGDITIIMTIYKWIWKHIPREELGTGIRNNTDTKSKRHDEWIKNKFRTETGKLVLINKIRKKMILWRSLPRIVKSDDGLA